MSQVISFADYRPSPRYDSIPWSEVRVQESDSPDGPWTLIDTIGLSPLDSDPSNPAVRNVTTSMASDTPDLWYRLVFADSGGSTLQPTFAVQNSEGQPPYATVEELALLLRVSANDRRTALERVLKSAAAEIDSELGLAEPFDSPPDIVVEVNIERAVEHWKQAQSPFGLIGLPGEGVPAFASADSWNRHAQKLAPLKESWGLA